MDFVSETRKLARRLINTFPNYTPELPAAWVEDFGSLRYALDDDRIRSAIVPRDLSRFYADRRWLKKYAGLKDGAQFEADTLEHLTRIRAMLRRAEGLDL